MPRARRDSADSPTVRCQGIGRRGGYSLKAGQPEHTPPPRSLKRGCAVPTSSQRARTRSQGGRWGTPAKGTDSPQSLLIQSSYKPATGNNNTCVGSVRGPGTTHACISRRHAPRRHQSQKKNAASEREQCVRASASARAPERGSDPATDGMSRCSVRREVLRSCGHRAERNVPRMSEQRRESRGGRNEHERAVNERARRRPPRARREASRSGPRL